MRTLVCDGELLPVVWEQAVAACWADGDRVPTQYDRPGDLPSCDCTLVMRVTDPLAEPRYHRCMCMGLNDLEKYVQELIYGVHDHYLEDVNNPNRWKYTYHDRLFNHPTGGNQIARMVSQLATCPHTRRAQAITWEAKGDPDLDDPPCLQSIWCRIVDNRLHMNVRFRSRDLFKAAFPNMVALTELQRKMAQAVSLLLGRLVLVGDYVDISDSAHLYGKDFKEIEGALAQWKLKPNLAQRTWTTTQALSCFIDGCDELLAESAVPKTRQVLVQLRRQEFVDLSVAKQSIVQS